MLFLRLIGFLGLLSVLGGHFWSAAKHQELYLICAVSYWGRLVSICQGGNWGVDGLFLISSFALVCVPLLATLLFSVILIFSGREHANFIRLASLSLIGLGLITGGGMLLVQANHNLSSVYGFDKIEVSNSLGIFPATFLLLGIILFLFGRSKVSRAPTL